jgi:5'-methylthioinosine phosphorylase
VSGDWAIIGGSGLNQLADRWETVFDGPTPYGDAAAPVQRARVAGRDVLFLPRHGQPHRIPPHLINYRANLWSLVQAGAGAVIATNAVGGIAAALAPGDLVLPDQIVDYTYGRAHTVMDETRLTHVDFTWPYDAAVRERIRAAAATANIPLHAAATYGCTQGPRLESAAEIRRLEHDGCDVVGMTGMPEAGLARELGLRYAALCVVVNPAAGKGGGPLLESDILRVAEAGMRRVVRLIAHVIEAPPP